jgi:hypothetical protein
VVDERLELAALGAFGQPADDCVPEAPPERVGELGCLVDAAGHLQDSVGTRSADRLVLAERGGDVIASCEPIGEDDGIFHRLPVLALLDRRDLQAEAQIAASGCEFGLQISSMEGDRPSSRSDGTRVSSPPSEVRIALRVAAAPRAATASPTPRRSSALIAFAKSVIPAPTGSTRGARSSTTTSLPVSRRAIAALSPASPPPTTITRTG